MHLVVGAPLAGDGAKPGLGALLISPGGAVREYRKMHLGGDEPQYFGPGHVPLVFTTGGHTIGVAICADTSQPSHPETCKAAGADIYAASVFLKADWYRTDTPRLARYAVRHRMLVVMANHGASTGALVSVGKSAVWSPGGALLVEAGDDEDALLIAACAAGEWRGELVTPRFF
jgi:predicted amidohydrolase